jgi:Mitochondrial carrier protein
VCKFLSFFLYNVINRSGLVVATPIEVLKCKAQVNRSESVKYRQIYQQIGVQGLYKGVLPLLCRDVPGWGVYFWAYELLK